MNYILFDNFRRNYLLPLSFTRPVADFRLGILTIREKWEMYLNAKISTLTEDYLNKKFPIHKEDDNILINGSICPTPALVDKVQNLKSGEALVSDTTIIALHVEADDLDKVGEGDTEGITEVLSEDTYLKIDNPWDIYSQNHKAIEEDYMLLKEKRKQAKLSKSNLVTARENIFIEEGAVVEHCILNASEGP
ncbi:MAG: putative sugar nucleotidyl transferase, partial [Bacteroidota bacterium]